MAVSTERLEDALTEAGFQPDAAPSLAAVLQSMVDEAVAERAEARSPEQRPSARVDSSEARLIRLEQKFDDLRELIMVQFAHVEQRFADVDKRQDRERRERWGIVTAAAGAITAGLLRVFGAI